MKVGLFSCQVCFIGAAPRNEHPPQSMHKDCVSLRILDIFYEALCAEMLIIIAQGLPERPHHVLGNLWIKIAGWLKRSGLSKHKQSGLTNMVDWLWFGFLPRQLWGLAEFSSELHLGVYTKLKCRTSRDWCSSHCLCSYAFGSLDIRCTSPCFSINQYDLCRESHCCLRRDWFAVM